MAPLLTFVLTAAVAGAAASLHCLGMCGGFAAALTARDPRSPVRAAVVARHALYHLGKLTSYLFIGALAAAAGAWVVHGSGLRWAQSALSVAAGFVFVWVGVGLLGLRPVRSGGVVGAWLAPLFRPLLAVQGPGGALALGVFNGLLPCPLVYAFAAQAAAAGDLLHGLAIMAGLSLGSIPALSLAGAAGRWLTPPRRRRWGRSVGAAIAAFGAITILRGLLIGGHALAGHRPAETSPAHVAVWRGVGEHVSALGAEGPLPTRGSDT